MSCALYMYQVETLHLSKVGPMPLFARSYLSGCLATRHSLYFIWSSLRRFFMHYYSLRGGYSSNILISHEVVLHIVLLHYAGVIHQMVLMCLKAFPCFIFVHFILSTSREEDLCSLYPWGGPMLLIFYEVDLYYNWHDTHSLMFRKEEPLSFIFCKTDPCSTLVIHEISIHPLGPDPSFLRRLFLPLLPESLLSLDIISCLQLLARRSHSRCLATVSISYHLLAL